MRYFKQSSAGRLFTVISAAHVLSLAAANSVAAPIPRLLATMPADTTIDSFNISPDGSWVTYTTEIILEREPMYNGARVRYGSLYSVPIQGGDVRQLNQPTHPDAFVEPRITAFTADSRSILFLGAMGEPTDGGLYRASLDGSSLMRLAPNATDGSPSSSDFRLLSDESRVIYHDNTTGNLWSVPLDGGDAIRLHSPLEMNANTFLPSDHIPPPFPYGGDPTRVAYNRFRTANSNLQSSDLFSVGIDGTGTQLLAGNIHRVNAVSSDGKYAIFNRRFDLSGLGSPIQFREYSVPMAGGTEIMLHPTLPRWASANVSDLTPDGKQAIMQLDFEQDEQLDLYRVSLDNGTMVRLNNPHRSGDRIDPVTLTPDGQHYIYSLTTSVDDTGGLYRASLNGDPLLRLGPPLPPGTETGSVVFSANGRRLAFTTGPGDSRLFSVNVDGTDLTQLGPPLPVGAGFSQFEMTGDGKRVLYLADVSIPNRNELFVVPTTGGLPVRLSPDLGPDGGSVQMLRVSRDLAVFSFGQQFDVRQLFAVQVLEPTSAITGMMALLACAAFERRRSCSSSQRLENGVIRARSDRLHDRPK